MLNLVIKELAKVLHIHTALLGVDHNGGATKGGIGKLQPLHRTDHVAELTNARGLNQNAVGGVVGHYLFKGTAKVAHEAATDTARVHLVDRNAGLAEKAAVNTDLTKLILNENELFACIGLGNQLFDKCGLPRTEKTRKNVNLGHSITSCFLYHDSAR